MSDNNNNERELADNILREILRSLQDGESNKHFAPYITKSRIISQTIHPFINLQRAFYAGVPEAAATAPEVEVEEGEDEYTNEERYVFDAIMKLERGFSVIVNACSDDTEAFLGLINKGSGHISSCASRSNDTAKLNASILEFIYEDPKSGSKFTSYYDVDRLSASDPKYARGFLHLDTADLLCPLRLRDEFEDDPVEFINKVSDGLISIKDDDFPSFMFATGTEYDPGDHTKGLFRGFLLVRVFRHIFTGPSSAIHATNAAIKTKAKVFRLREITGRMIAYTAVQCYFVLSSAKKWVEYIGDFNLDHFYDNIVAIFEENADEPFIRETLDWWDGQILGLRSLKKKGKQTCPERPRIGPNPAERLRAQFERQRRLNEQSQLEQRQHELQQVEDAREVTLQIVRQRATPYLGHQTDNSIDEGNGNDDDDDNNSEMEQEREQVEEIVEQSYDDRQQLEQRKLRNQYYQSSQRKEKVPRQWMDLPESELRIQRHVGGTGNNATTQAPLYCTRSATKRALMDRHLSESELTPVEELQPPRWKKARLISKNLKRV